MELQGEQVPAHKPPGHSIMFHLLNDSPMLALCLSLLEEGVRQLDTYAPFPGEKACTAVRQMERTCVFVLTEECITLPLQVKSTCSLQYCTACAFWTWLCRRKQCSWIFLGRARPLCWFLPWSSSSKASALKPEGLITLSTLRGKHILFKFFKIMFEL